MLSSGNHSRDELTTYSHEKTLGIVPLSKKDNAWAPINVQLQPGESIEEALIRAELTTPLEKGPRKTITIPPGVSIIGPRLKQTHITKRKTTGVPFLDHGSKS